MTHVFCRCTAEISSSNYLNLLLSWFNHTFRFFVTHFDISPIKCALWKRSETPTFHVLSRKSGRGTSGRISRLPVNVMRAPPSEIGQCYFKLHRHWPNPFRRQAISENNSGFESQKGLRLTEQGIFLCESKIILYYLFLFLSW